jgi:zinc/manganese transport system substrate-binding protein
MKCLVALVGFVMLGVSACSSASPSPSASGPGSPPTGGNAPISVVASTNVYGDIARTVGGASVTVTSIIDNPDKDPHEYQADAQTQLALSKAQLVVENGGGYDDFVDVMLESASSKPMVINVVDLSGGNRQSGGAEFNEHVWYDVRTVGKLTTQLATDLSAAVPEQAATINANADAFASRLTKLQQQEAAIKAEHAGDPVAITEPVPVYLLQAAGLVNKTPDEFSEAIEEDTDAPPAILKQTEDLFDKGQVKLLAYNEQTTGPQTDAVLAAAKGNNIPVVPVTETLPAGQTYFSWMQTNLDAVSAVLNR